MGAARGRAELIPQIVARMKGRVGFEDAKLSVRQLARLEAAGSGRCGARPGGRPRRAASRGQGARRAASDRRRGRAQPTGSTSGRSSVASSGRTERDVARAVEARIRELGAEPSFPPIVAAAENGALPHASPASARSRAGELVVFDMGSLLDGYCSDCTRTFATGEVEDDAREVYELVLRAQQAALEAVRPAASGKEVDAVAREMISEARLRRPLRTRARTRSRTGGARGATARGNLGGRSLRGQRRHRRARRLYARRFGVRIEDLVVVTAEGHRNLSGLPKDLQVVD